MVTQLIYPNQRTLTKILTRLEELGVHIPPIHAAAVIAAHEEFLMETTEGREKIIDKFEFDSSCGKTNCLYDVVKDDGSSTTYSGDKVFFLQTCVVGGNFVSPHQVCEKEKETEECKHCGKDLHCIDTIFNKVSNEAIKVCSYCKQFEWGGHSECTRCTSKCEHVKLKAVVGR